MTTPPMAKPRVAAGALFFDAADHVLLSASGVPRRSSTTADASAHEPSGHAGRHFGPPDGQQVRLDQRSGSGAPCLPVARCTGSQLEAADQIGNRQLEPNTGLANKVYDELNPHV